MTDNTSLNTASVNRRKFLQATGAVGAISSAGVVNVKALSPEDGQSLGYVQFTEVGVTYDVETDIGSNWELPVQTVDDLVGHNIDKTEGVLYLNKFASDEDITTFKQHDRVMRTDDYFALPASIDTTSQRHLVTGRSRRNRVVESLRLETPYQTPQITAQLRGQRVAVQAGKKTIETAPGTTKTTELPSHSVQSTVIQPTDERADALDVPESRQPLKYLKESRILTVTPTVSVKHFGSLEVVDVSEQTTPSQ